jgi:polyphosphate glucokinase
MRTLSLDLGATKLKGALLDADGASLAEPQRVLTVNPCSPSGLMSQIDELAQSFDQPDRLTVGFPGVMRDGRVLTAPLFWGLHGPGSDRDPGLVEAWTDFDLAGELNARFGVPVRAVNDSALHAAAVVEGHGVELVVTLGTGIGTTIVQSGRISAHLDLAHHPARGNFTYNQFIGDAALRAIGRGPWLKRVHTALDQLVELTLCDRLYIGGGNAEHLRHKNVPWPRAQLIDPMAGARGGARVWALEVP